MKRLSLLALAAAAIAAAADPATIAPAEPALLGAKAVLAAALRPPEKAAPKPVEPSDDDRYREALGRLRAAGGAGPSAADWLAAVDCGLRLPPDGRNRSGLLWDLLDSLPGPREWDALRAGLRERAAGEPPPAGPWVLPALRVAVEFLAGGGRGVPEEAFAPFAAAAAPEGVDPGRFDRARAALRRAMENPGQPAPAPFSATRFEARLDRALRGTASERLVWPAEVAALPDETRTPLLRRALAGANPWETGLDSDLPPAVADRLVEAATADPAACGPAAWALVRMDDARGRALFDALVAAHDPLGGIRRRMREAAADLAADAADALVAPEPPDPEDVFDRNDYRGEPGAYAGLLANAVKAELDAGRLASAEALAAPLEPSDWPAVCALGRPLVPSRSFETWIAFLEPRLPAGAALLDSPLLTAWEVACAETAPERFPDAFRARLGDAADSRRAAEELARFRLRVARLEGHLDAVGESVFAGVEDNVRDLLETERPGGVAAWCARLAALGETKRLSAALDRVLGSAAAMWTEGWISSPVWAVRRLAEAGRPADAEALARDALRHGARRSGGWFFDGVVDEDPAVALLWLYVRAGRPRDALEFAAGWPFWNDPGLPAPCCRSEPDETPALLAQALASAGGDEGAATAETIARIALLGHRVYRWEDRPTIDDWPGDVLAATMPPERFRALLDGLLLARPRHEWLWRWKARSLLRDGELDAAEAAARRAVALESDGRGRARDALADVLDARGGPDARAAAAALRRGATAERAASLAEGTLDDGLRSLAIRRLEAAARLAADAPDVGWKIAALLRRAGRAQEADALAADALRNAGAWLGPVDGVRFGDDAARAAAEAILPALAEAPDAGANVRFLLARLRAAQGRTDDAIDECGRALALDPGHFAAAAEMLRLCDEAGRPAAERGRLQTLLARLDPCFEAERGTAPSRIVDWPGLWRAFDDAAAAAPPVWTPKEEILYRFAAAARIADAQRAAKRAAAAAAAEEAGAGPDAGADETGGDGWGERLRFEPGDLDPFAGHSPVRLLGQAPWCWRLVDLASVLSGDVRPVRRARSRRRDDEDAVSYCIAPGPSHESAADRETDPWSAAGDDAYFYDD